MNRLDRFFIRTPDHYDICDEDLLSDVLGEESTILVITDGVDQSTRLVPNDVKMQQIFYSSDETEIEDIISKFSPIPSDNENHDQFPDPGDKPINPYEGLDDEDDGVNNETIVLPARSADASDEDDESDALDEESLSVTESLDENDELDFDSDDDVHLEVSNDSRTSTVPSICEEKAKQQSDGFSSPCKHISDNKSLKEKSMEDVISEHESSDEDARSPSCNTASSKKQNGCVSLISSAPTADESTSFSDEDDDRFKGAIFAQHSPVPLKKPNAFERSLLPPKSQCFKQKPASFTTSPSSSSASSSEDESEQEKPSSKLGIDDCFKNVPSFSSLFIEDVQKKATERIKAPIPITTPRLITPQVLTEAPLISLPVPSTSKPSVASAMVADESAKENNKAKNTAPRVKRPSTRRKATHPQD